MILANVVLVFLRLVDNYKLLLHYLSELHLFALLDNRQLGLFELSDREDVVAVFIVLILPRFDAAKCPGQSPLCCISRIPNCEISLISRVKVRCCVGLTKWYCISAELLPAAARAARLKVIKVLKSMARVYCLRKVGDN